ncbi:AraC family transcriptional regulator [Xanthocytophaga agilis]|uniref:AraC family transcriptional regulator n=1 Tax=Xanthocytophaga agilis TaxID=3048010 RepID=A0AAE3RBJ3_9BACT|nr:AraC family transcriptional regulator [Xanthocytophaga agilis]MDJ1504413.1 AraC family transcriptional regulator [Xanthocytophaga agilis]
MTYYNQQVLLIREQYYPKPYIIDRLIQARKLIDLHSGSSICIGSMSDKVSLSKFHFIRLFKRCYGRTPHQYLIERRISEAKILLSKNMSVMDTCFQIGFESPTSFSLLFKRYTGLTPSDYRQKSNFR